FEHSATALLPNVVGSLLYGGSHGVVNRRRCPTLHVRHQVAVDVECDRNAGMPQCPNRSCTIFGWTFAASMWLAWVWRILQYRGCHFLKCEDSKSTIKSRLNVDKI